jgi:hypothetical protein
MLLNNSLIMILVSTPHDMTAPQIGFGRDSKPSRLASEIKEESVHGCYVLDSELQPIHTLTVVEFYKQEDMCKVRIYKSGEFYRLNSFLYDWSEAVVPQAVLNVKRNVLPSLAYIGIPTTIIPWAALSFPPKKQEPMKDSAKENENNERFSVLDFAVRHFVRGSVTIREYYGDGFDYNVYGIDMYGICDIRDDSGSKNSRIKNDESEGSDSEDDSLDSDSEDSSKKEDICETSSDSRNQGEKIQDLKRLVAVYLSILSLVSNRPKYT